MINRFIGDENGPNLIVALNRQVLINGNNSLAKKIKSKIILKEYKKDDIIFKQGDSSNDIYFLLIGSVSININGRSIVERKEGTHFGEMAAINPTSPRSATIICQSDVVIGLLTEYEFRKLSDENPEMLRSIATEVSSRLMQRNRLVRPVNPIPVLFIASSKESLSVAREFKAQLEDSELKVNLWSDFGVFNYSKFPIQDLENQVKSSDFALIVFGADDKVLSRFRFINSTRDNVLLELGLFTGALSHERTFIALPKKKKIKIPSDIFGINPVMIDLNGKITDEIKNKSIEIKSLIKKIGCL